jgi:hypothetical protein
MAVDPDQSTPIPIPITAREATSQGATKNGNDSLEKEKDEVGSGEPSQQEAPDETDHSQESYSPKYESIDKESEDKPLTSRQRWKAYAATLFLMGSVVHIVASIVTVTLFFVLSLPPSLSLWFVCVCGSASTYIVFLILAGFCCSSFGTVQGAGMRSFGQLRMQLCQLQARLDALGIVGESSVAFESEGFSNAAKVEAYRCFESARWYLQEHRAGLRWVTGMGYINAWGLVHRAEEALVKVEPAEMVFRGAVHDRLAIQDSKIGKRDELLNKLTTAAIDLYPDGAIYFIDDSQLLRKIAEVVNKIHAAQPPVDIDDLKSNSRGRQNAARLMLSEIRRTLNEYRDNLWESIFRERNRLMNTVAITGLVTHILLCITIVMMGLIHAEKTLLMAATAYYMVGAIAGLFLRFWNEINSDSAMEDFNLSMARLLATPLLSGLAGVGGVLISLLLSDILTSSSHAITFASMFRFDPNYFLTAAAFGLAPDLLIRGLQQKVAKYSSELRRSKGGSQEDQ